MDGVTTIGPTLYTTEQVAEYLGLSVRSVQSLCYEGRLAFVKIGRQVRFTSAMVEEYIEASTTPVDPMAFSASVDSWGRAIA